MVVIFMKCRRRKYKKTRKDNLAKVQPAKAPNYHAPHFDFAFKQRGIYKFKNILPPLFNKLVVNEYLHHIPC
jgi:hypothetical protein